MSRKGPCTQIGCFKGSVKGTIGFRVQGSIYPNRIYFGPTVTEYGASPRVQVSAYFQTLNPI